MTIELLTSTEAGDACMDALAQGTLVPDTRSGLGLRDSNGDITSVVWPMGYSALWTDGLIVLFDPSGTAIAQQGDIVQMGGGSGRAGHFYACAGSVERVPPS